MQIKKTIKRIAITAILAIGVTPSFGQDLLARQAPIDRRATRVDTMALHLIEQNEASAAVAQLYNEWSNKYAHRATALPDSFRIDLRHFCMPTPSRLITSNFGRRWGRMHKGLDIKVYIGDTIRAAFDGKIRVVRYEAGGYGNFVVIRHNNGLETIYGHMSKHLVAENQNVKAGDPIGLGGNTGRSTGSHLHFETRLCGVALNPALMFDFKNQDVTGDFYTFRRSSYDRDSDRATRMYGKPADTRNPVTSAPAPSQSSRQKELAMNNSRFDKQTRESKRQKKADLKKEKKEMAKKSTRTHKVTKGDTLYSIAQRYGVSVEQLCKINRIGKNKHIRPGQVLRCS